MRWLLDRVWAALISTHYVPYDIFSTYTRGPGSVSIHNLRTVAPRYGELLVLLVYLTPPRVDVFRRLVRGGGRDARSPHTHACSSRCCRLATGIALSAFGAGAALAPGVIHALVECFAVAPEFVGCCLGGGCGDVVVVVSASSSSALAELSTMPDGSLVVSPTSPIGVPGTYVVVATAGGHREVGCVRRRDGRRGGVEVDGVAGAGVRGRRRDRERAHEDTPSGLEAPRMEEERRRRIVRSRSGRSGRRRRRCRRRSDEDGPRTPSASRRPTLRRARSSSPSCGSPSSATPPAASPSCRRRGRCSRTSSPASRRRSSPLPSPPATCPLSGSAWP